MIEQWTQRVLEWWRKRQDERAFAADEAQAAEDRAALPPPWCQAIHYIVNTRTTEQPGQLVVHVPYANPKTPSRYELNDVPNTHDMIQLIQCLIDEIRSRDGDHTN